MLAAAAAALSTSANWQESRLATLANEPCAMVLWKESSVRPGQIVECSVVYGCLTYLVLDWTVRCALSDHGLAGWRVGGRELQKIAISQSRQVDPMSKLSKVAKANRRAKEEVNLLLDRSGGSGVRNRNASTTTTTLISGIRGRALSKLLDPSEVDKRPSFALPCLHSPAVRGRKHSEGDGRAKRTAEASFHHIIAETCHPPPVKQNEGIPSR